MIQRFRIGNNLSVTWLLYEDDGNIHNLEGREIELYMTCGGYKYPVTDYTVTENAVAWVFPAAMQTKTGYYKLVLLERDAVRGLYSFDVADAFCLEPKSALKNIKTIIDEDAAVQVKSVLTYAHITNLASIDIVQVEGGYDAVVHLTNGKSFTIPVGAGGGGIATNIIDNLNSHSTEDALSANQGRILKEMIQAIPSSQINVINSLDSTSTTDPLSANMGRELKRLIDNIPGGGGGGGGSSVEIVDNLTSGGRNKALSAEQGKILKALIDAIPGSTSESIVQTLYSSDAEPGTPATNPGAWGNRTSSSIWIAIRFKEGLDWGEWTVLFLGEIELPYATFKSFAFTRSNDSSVSAPTGGSYSSPVPTTTGWSDGIPAGTGKIWMSTRTFASDDTHSDSAWSTPREVADSEYMDYEFSSVANPGTPSKATPSSTNTNPNWSNTASESTIWMAMREVSNGAYKTGSSWMVVKIKGEDGKDGSSVRILGSYSSSSELPSDYEGEVGDGYLVDGDLWVWDGDSWVNVGPVKGEDGEDGQTPFIHIKYSNDGGLHFTGNDGEDPGDYIGLYWDYNAADSDDVSDYTWKYWKGEDGFGYEYIFKLTTDATAPLLPASSPNTDDYVPEGWTDDPGLDPAVVATYKWCWVAWRKKEDGVWSAWRGQANGRARLYAHYGEEGPSGQAQFTSVVFMRSAEQPATPSNGTIPHTTSYGGTFDDPIPYGGWSDGIPPLVTNTSNPAVNTLWMTSRRFTDDGLSPQDTNWKTPAQAVDTNDIDIEFAYKQTNDATPVAPNASNTHGGSGTQVWFDPIADAYDGSVLRDFTEMYWMAICHKINGERVGSWAISRIKGEKGTDGVNGKDAKPVRIRKWSDVSGQTLTGNQRVFSGYEDGAPFRDVLIIHKSDYPSGTTYPWTDGGNAVPVLVTINYNNSYESGFPGSYFTSARLPQGNNYSDNLPASQSESASATALGVIWSTFANLGAIYVQLLVATQAYIGGLTVDHLTTNASNNSYIDIDDGFIRFFDTDGNLRVEMGQGSGDSSPVLKFYSASDPIHPLYDLGPNGIRHLGDIVEMPEITAYRFHRFTTKPQVGAAFDWQNEGTDATLYKYKDGRRIVRIGSNSGVEYWNPAIGQYQSSHSLIDGQYIASADATAPVSTTGFYIIAPYLWTTYSGSVEQAMLLDVRSGETNFEGYIRVDCPDHSGLGTITAVYTRDEK